MILDRLGQRLSLLHWEARDLPERHHTLRSAIDWSHDLLGGGFHHDRGSIRLGRGHTGRGLPSRASRHGVPADRAPLPHDVPGRRLGYRLRRRGLVIEIVG
jgi:predicted ATPase